MNITTIVTQMTILLLIMIAGFVGAKKNIFNDEVNVYASNILLNEYNGWASPSNTVK